MRALSASSSRPAQAAAALCAPKNPYVNNAIPINFNANGDASDVSTPIIIAASAINNVRPLPIRSLNRPINADDAVPIKYSRNTKPTCVCVNEYGGANNI